MAIAFDINLRTCNNASTTSHEWQYGLGWMGRGKRCMCMRGSMVWGGWAEVADAAMSAWFGLDGQRWEMQPWQYGLGWMGKAERCMHISLVWGGCSEVGDACMAVWFGVDGQRWEMHAWQHGFGWMGRGWRRMHGSMVWGGWA